jgi:hypothetical protein
MLPIIFAANCKFKVNNFKSQFYLLMNAVQYSARRKDEQYGTAVMLNFTLWRQPVLISTRSKAKLKEDLGMFP